MSPEGNNWANGVFSADKLGQSAAGFSTGYDHVIVVGFSAGRSSSTFKNDVETVQPSSIRLLPCIKL